MHNTPYVYSKVRPGRYHFISEGKRNIEKAVEFLPVPRVNVYNLGFGDVLPDGGIDDMTISNNGDIVKIFTTIINIVQDFTKEDPSTIIAFSGSTPKRTALYNRIIRTYYQSFSEQFAIWGIVETENGTDEIEFNPGMSCFYLVFFIKRIK